jgi:putative serine protease PepD
MRSRIWIIAAFLVGGFVLGTTWQRFKGRELLTATPVSTPLWSGPSVAQGAGLSADELNNIEIYKRAHDATVNISSTVYRRGWLFEVYPARESGSGFFVDEKGHILTNNHVVSGTAELTVILSDQSRYKATVLERDPYNDLALIKVNPRKTPVTLPLGDSDKLQVGQKVLAIGNPFGLQGTLTTGIVSMLGRDIGTESERLEGMIQTDAAINPGNSGGPLLDSSGNVIGINTAIYGQSGNIGIGFAMPINRAKVMLEEFQTRGRFARPRLGVEVALVRGDLAEMLNLPPEGGLLIQGVARGSAAESAGLRGPRQVVVVGNYELGVGGDLIMAIDGRAVTTVDALSRALSRKRPGEKIELTIFRNGSQTKVSVTLGEAPRVL